MAGLVPAIHVLLTARPEDVDARDERGHDSFEDSAWDKPGDDRM
jgi:hypothetical protein